MFDDNGQPFGPTSSKINNITGILARCFKILPAMNSTWKFMGYECKDDPGIIIV